MKYVFISIGIFVFFIFVSISEAVEVTQIEPAKVRVIVAPGSAKTGTIKIDNPYSEPKNVKVYVEDWVYLPGCDGTKDFRPAGTTDLSAAEWISFSLAEFKVPAFGRQILNYTVRIPSEAKGGHYAVIFFENTLGDQKNVPQAEGVNVNLAVRVASLFYVEPQGTINRQAKIENLKVINKGYGNFSVTVNFINTGNVDITTKGSFSIIDRKGMVYARGEFNDVYTFPQDTAVLVSQCKELIPKGVYDLILTIDTGKALEELGLGRGPVITKEAEIEIDKDGQVRKIGRLQ